MASIKFRFSLLLVFSLLIQGCASGTCRGLAKKKEDNVKALQMDLVKIYKYDGSLQCGMGRQIPLEEMQNELEGIKIYSSQHKDDGLMRIQLCGSPTGKANVYQIAKSDLEKALALGFKQWTFD